MRSVAKTRQQLTALTTTSSTTTATATATAAAAAAARSRSSPKPPPPPPSAALLLKADQIRCQLSSLYPPPLAAPLNSSSTFQHLVAVMLSAQTTDKKVNQVTHNLFKKAPTPFEMKDLGEADIQSMIREIGLAPTKAKR